MTPTDNRAGAHLAQDEQIDWFALIVELERSGYPHNAIATFVGVSRRTVGSWKQGARPKFEEGEAAIGLWSQVTGKRQDSAPRVKRHSYRA